MSILVLQSPWWGRENCLLCLICLPGVSWWLSGSSSRCHGVVCGLWLCYFLIILTYYLRIMHSKWCCHGHKYAVILIFTLIFVLFVSNFIKKCWFFLLCYWQNLKKHTHIKTSISPTCYSIKPSSNWMSGCHGNCCNELGRANLGNFCLVARQPRPVWSKICLTFVMIGGDNDVSKHKHC